MKAASIKMCMRLGLWLWPAYWIAQIFIGDLGASPALELNHKLGNVALTLLSLNLVLGALLDIRRPAPAWLRFWVSERRFWGVSSFLVLLIHIFFYFVNEGFEGKAWTQIYTKTYLIFASLSFTILFVLALTSNGYSVRRLGPLRWKKIHRAVYAVQILLFGHILLIEKADLIFYGAWLSCLLSLQIVRLGVRVYRRKPAGGRV